MASICSINDCKRAATCLCLHCEQKVCARHFNEHQGQVNDELLPFTDRLNELRMKLRSNESQNGPWSMLRIWRDEKYKEIEGEYNRKVQEFNEKISKQEEGISQIIAKIEELVNEGEASFDQIRQLKKDIEILENHVNMLMANEQTQTLSKDNATRWYPVNTRLKLGTNYCLIKGRVFCGDEDLYALECEKPMASYDGLCPKCRVAHVSLPPNRGFYAYCERVHDDGEIRKKK